MSSAAFLAVGRRGGEQPAGGLGPLAQLLDARHPPRVPLDRSVKSLRISAARRRADSGRRYGSTTRSSRWTTSWGGPRGGRRCGGRRRCGAATTCSGVRPLANTRAVVVDDLDGGVGVEAAVDVAHARGAATTCRRSTSARRAPASTMIRPFGRPARTRSRACGSASRCARGANDVPTGLPGERVGHDTRRPRPTRSPTRTPDHAAIFAAASLLAMPPLPRSVPAPPATVSSAASTSTISSMSDASSSCRGSAVNTPAGVGEHQQRVGAEQVRDERGEPVVVAVADLVVGDVSFSLTIGSTPRSSRRCSVSRAWRYWTAVHEVVRREQHLAGDDVVRAEQIAFIRSSRRGWPTAAIACSVPDVGRAAS